MPKNDFNDKNIFELMKAPIEELKELSIEDFAKRIDNKKVNFHPFTGNEHLDANGNIYISATNVNVLVQNDSGGYRISIWGESSAKSQLYVNLSENFIFGIYSYENGKSYRIAFEGNSPDLLVTVVGGRVDRKKDE